MEATQQNQTVGTSAGLRSALVISAMYDRQPKWMLTYHLKLTALHTSTRLPGHDCAPQYLEVEPLMDHGHLMLDYLL